MNKPTLLISRRTEVGNDGFGQPILGRETQEMVCPVRLSFSSQHTTVRTDSAASHGHAYENVSDVVILARPVSKIKLGDILTIAGNRVIATTVHPRFAVDGRLDHIEIHCSAWK